MKKFFIKGTNEEIQYGDKLELDITEGKGKNVVHHRMKCKFIPALENLLLEEGIIEQKEDDSPEVMLEKILDGISKIETIYKDLDNRLTELEGIIADRK